MRALILAAGRGSRMGDETAARPKGLSELHGRCLIDWQLAALRAAGIDEVAMVRGYRGDQLTFDVRYFENPRWETTNMVASLACAEEWLVEGTTLVSYADIVYEPAAARALMQIDDEIAVAYDTKWRDLWERRFDDPLSDAETFEIDARGLLTDVGGRPSAVQDVQGQYMGLTRLTQRGARTLFDLYRALDAETRDGQDMTGLLQLLLREDVPVRGVPFDGWWCEVDQASDLAIAAEVVPRDGLEALR